MDRETVAEWVYTLQDYELERRGNHGATFDAALTNALINLRALYHAMDAIAATPDTAPAGVTGSGARYGYAQVGDGIFYVADEDGSYLDPEYSTEESVQAEVNRLNAALPASGNADTVAGSGNGGE